MKNNKFYKINDKYDNNHETLVSDFLKSNFIFNGEKLLNSFEVVNSSFPCELLQEEYSTLCNF